jgi:mono/diheme cytochrome c family protein
MTRCSPRLFAILLVALVGAGACHRGEPASGGGVTMKSAKPPRMPAGVTKALIALGDTLFHAPAASCQKCHGPDGTGGANGPSLVAGPWLQSSGAFDEINGIIIAGVSRDRIKVATHRFQMNPRGGPMQLGDVQARELAAYVWSISRKKTRA